MKLIQKILQILILLTAYTININSSCSTTTPTSQNLWQPHTSSAYSSTNLIQIKEAYLKASQNDKSKDRYMYLTCFGEFKQSYGCGSLGSLPFWGASGNNTMTIGTNNGLSDLDAYQFGMGDVTTTGSITLNPSVQYFGVDTQWYYMQHTSGRGIVAKIDAPLSAMRMTTKLTENPAVLSNTDDLVWTPPYPAVANRPQTLSAAFQSGSIAGNSLESEVHHPITLYKGKISSYCSQTQIRLADLSFTLGYNCINNNTGMLMFGAKVTCPTGNVPNGDYVLEPIVGRAGHWGVGGEMTASYRAWHNEKSELRLWSQGEILHLFNGRRPSFRSFDLALNGKGSKYLLLQYYASLNPDLTATPANPTGKYGTFITQAVNLTTYPVFSQISVEGSFALMLDYTRENWNLGIGGQVWGRSQECLSIDYCSALRYGMVNLNNYAVLGRQVNKNNTDNTVLSYCEPLAKINQSVARQTTTDNAFPDQVKDARLATNRIPADLTVALDICGAQAPRAITGQIFGELGYTWKDHAHTPNIAIFGSAEFADKKSAMTNFWSVGIKASLAFGNTVTHQSISQPTEDTKFLQSQENTLNDTNPLESSKSEDFLTEEQPTITITNPQQEELQNYPPFENENNANVIPVTEDMLTEPSQEAEIIESSIEIKPDTIITDAQNDQEQQLEHPLLDNAPSVEDIPANTPSETMTEMLPDNIDTSIQNQNEEPMTTDDSEK